MNDFLNIVLILGAGHGFFVGIVLLLKKPRIIANMIFAVLISGFSFLLILSIYELKTSLEISVYHVIAFPLLFLFGPLFYFYVATLTSFVTKFKKIYLLHILPFVIIALYVAPYFFASDLEKKLSANSLTVVDEIFELVTVIHIIVYYIISYRLLNKYSQKIKNFFSDTEKINLLWLRTVIVINIVIDFLAISSGFLISMNNEFTFFSKVGSEIGAVFFIYVAGYFVMQRPEIFTQTSLMEEEKKEAVLSEEKYKKTKLSDNFLDEYLATITEYVENTKIFRDPDLNLKQLSEDIDISIHNISQVINSRLNMNFFNFINSYRIKDAMELLTNKEESKTVLEIAFEVGFNSKATFNSIFKKTTELTPTEYKKENMS